MENMAQSSKFVERFPSNDDENQSSRHNNGEDEPMDITEQSDSIVDQNFSSYLNLVQLTFIFIIFCFINFFFCPLELFQFYGRRQSANSAIVNSSKTSVS